MTVKKLIEELKKVDGDLNVFTEKKDLGNIGNVFFVRKDEYSFFGCVSDCIIISDDSDEGD